MYIPTMLLSESISVTKSQLCKRQKHNALVSTASRSDRVSFFIYRKGTTMFIQQISG